MDTPAPSPTPTRLCRSCCRRPFQRLGDFELCVAPQVAGEVHADPPIQNLLQFVGQRQVLDDEGLERHSERGQRGLQRRRHLLCQLRLVSRHIQERHFGGSHHLGQARHNRVAKLAFEIRDAVNLARAAHVGEERPRIGDAVGVNAVRAQAHGTEFLLPDVIGVAVPQR